MLDKRIGVAVIYIFVCLFQQGNIRRALTLTNEMLSLSKYDSDRATIYEKELERI